MDPTQLPDVAVESAQSAPAETALTEGVTPATAETDETGEQQEVVLPATYDEWVEHVNKVPELREEHERRGKDTAKEQYRRFQSAIQPAIDRWSQNSDASRATLTQIASALQSSVEDGTLDTRALNNVLNQNRAALDAFNGQQWWEGTFYILNTLGQSIEDEAFGNEFLGRLNKMATRGGVDPTFAEDMLDRIAQPIVERKLKDAETKGYERGLKEGRKAATENARAAGRVGQKPDTAPKGQGAQRSDAELLSDPTTPIDKIIEIRSRQKSGK